MDLAQGRLEGIWTWEVWSRVEMEREKGEGIGDHQGQEATG